MGGAGLAVAENTYLPYFLYFLDDVPPPPSSSSPPTSRATALHRRLHYGHGHQGEDNLFPALVDTPALSLRAAPPPLVMPAFVPGWVYLLQVPLPSSTRARSLA
jgi:hypothetical protein